MQFNSLAGFKCLQAPLLEDVIHKLGHFLQLKLLTHKHKMVLM